MAGVNKNNSAIKRIMLEARELANDPCTDYVAAPLEDDIFEWHCTLRGPADTEFEGGLYHFRITLPPEYPFRPPSIIMLTPNGRFELNTKLFTSHSPYRTLDHEELWQPAWGVRTAIVGLQGFFPLKGTNAVGLGAVEYPPAERRRLAKLSREWTCPQCQQRNLDLLPDPVSGEAAAAHHHDEEPSASTPDTDTTGSDAALSTAPPSDVPMAIHSVEVPLPTGSVQANSGIPGPAVSAAMLNRTTVETTPVTQASATNAQRPRRTAPSARRPPLLLDTVICMLLAIVVALIYRRLT
ncbi:ubiquitin-conjugating enzyme/RWD-like protein [Schizophyllum fasciatum]